MIVSTRSISPGRISDQRDDYFKKDLGVLARAGFSYHLARRVLEVEDEDALQHLLEDTQN